MAEQLKDNNKIEKITLFVGFASSFLTIAGILSYPIFYEDPADMLFYIIAICLVFLLTLTFIGIYIITKILYLRSRVADHKRELLTFAIQVGILISAIMFTVLMIYYHGVEENFEVSYIFRILKNILFIVNVGFCNISIIKPSKSKN